jgi:hypothetical protein
MNLLSFLSVGFFLLILAEISTRRYWKKKHKISFSDPSRWLYALYPELRSVRKGQPSRSDPFYNILILGTSTLTDEWGAVGSYLSEQLAERGYREARVFNLSGNGRTSRDHRIRYAALGGYHFDLVVVYTACSEAKVNNTPPAVFKEDYSHMPRLAAANQIARYQRKTLFGLVYTLRALVLQLRIKLNRDSFIPAFKPREDWLPYGRELKSTAAFHRNLTEIIRLASQRQEKLVLVTCAIQSDEEYSLTAFKEKRLNYVRHSLPFETWGLQSNVLKAVLTHNEVMRELAQQHTEIGLVDEEKLMAGEWRYFNDPCHLTVVGSMKFVGNLWPHIVSEIESGRKRRFRDRAEDSSPTSKDNGTGR